MSDPIRFHFDIISPYAYLAWTQVNALAKRHHRTVLPIPTLFARLLAHGETKGPAEIPDKRIYVFKDIVRTARALRIPLTPPASHPFNPLVALRTASLEMPEEEQRKLIDALFRATWATGSDVETPEQVAKIANDIGLDGNDLVKRAGEPEAKARLRKQTEDAISQGVFGVPTMFADGEMFWGFDSFWHFDRHLKGERVDLTADLEKWNNIQPTAVRRM